MADSSDNFYIQFPSQSTPQQRVVLMASGLMLDYSFFEEQP
ncbi:MAG: phospholipid scramblase-related protein [bacterium]